MLSSHFILCYPLLLLPSIFPSIRVFSSELALCITWPKYWSFNFSISPSNEYSGLISFRMDWLDLLAVQGTLKSLLQRHSSKASILWYSTFFGHLMQRTDLFEKTLMLGKIEGRRKRGQQGMRWLDGTTDSTDMNLSKFWEIVKGRGAWSAAVHGVARSRPD